MTKICIPLNPNGGTFGNDTELRLMLRSLQTYWVGLLPEIVILGRKPAWLTGVTHIPATTLEDAQNAAAQFSSFIWWYDDCFLLQPTGIKDVKVPRYDGDLEPGTHSEWQRNLGRVKEALVKVGRTVKDFSKPHAPTTYAGKDFARALTYWVPQDISYKFPIESWISNDGRACMPATDVATHYASAFQAPSSSTRFLVVNGYGITSALQWLRAKFSEPSKFEQPCAEEPVVLTLSSGGGLGANMVRIASVADAWHGRDLRVDWKGDHKFYSLAPDINVFKELFDAEGEIDPNWARIPDYPETVRRVSGDGFLYLHPHWTRIRKSLSLTLTRMCRPRPEIYSKVIAMTGSSSPGDEMVGMVYRVESGVRLEQLGAKVTPLPDFADCVEERADGRRIMVCCNDAESVEYLRQRWKSRALFLPGVATNPPHKGQGVEHLKETLAIMLALSTCDELVHSVSNMALVPLLLSPDMPHRFVQWVRPLINETYEY